MGISHCHMHEEPPCNKSWRVTLQLMSAVDQSILQSYMLFKSMGEASWHQRWHTKPSVFPFTVSPPVIIWDLFFFFLVAVFFCSFFALVETLWHHRDPWWTKEAEHCLFCCNYAILYVGGPGHYPASHLFFSLTSLLHALPHHWVVQFNTFFQKHENIHTSTKFTYKC